MDDSDAVEAACDPVRVPSCRCLGHARLMGPRERHEAGVTVVVGWLGR